MKTILAMLVVGFLAGSAVAFAGGTGHGGSCKKDGDCHPGLSCKFDKNKGHKTCQ